jgi:RHS repeat-associated protein
VTDALGTPRIVQGKTGSLSDVTRHDYLPFGEELYVNMGTNSIRSTTMGYGTGGTNDGLRKKFTGYERDDETGLDFAQARYYSSRQGRFLSPDEFTGGPDELFDFADIASDNPTFYAEIEDPQSLNKYQYCYNSPLSNIDPDGHGPLKILKVVYKGIKKGDAAAGFADNIADAQNIVDPNSSTISKVGSALSIASEFAPVSVGDVKDGYRLVKGLFKRSDDAADAAKATARGVEAEKRVLADIGEVKNTKKVSSAEGSAIPDYQNKTTVGEIKDTKKVSDTRQIRIQREAAKASSRQHVIYTGTRTKVSKRVLEQSKVKRRDDLGPQDE